MSTNDITGDRIISKAPSKDYRDNFDGIFKKKPLTVADRYNVIMATCIKCSRDWSKRCGYCGLLQADGSIIKTDPEIPAPTDNPPNNEHKAIT